MEYYKVTIPIEEIKIESEVIIALLSNLGYESFEEKPDVLLAYIPSHDFNKQDLLQIPFLTEVIDKDLISIELMPDINWNEVWESNYDSVLINEQCYIRAPFHPSLPTVKYDIIIKPKMAFGTAHHETTAMMIELMLNTDFEGKNVLDIGCGSGVLAILASMKGAESVTAIDIDSWSTENTIENYEINEISNIVVVLGGAQSIPQTSSFDYILANINKNILIQDMKLYSDALKYGGSIFFSGFYSDDLPDIIDSAKLFDLDFISNIEKNNWVASLFVKNKKQK